MSRKSSTIGAILFLVVLLHPSPCWGLGGIDASAARGDVELQSRWQQLKPSWAGAKYSSTPVLAAPYAPGACTDGYLADGVNMINFARFTAGLPDAVRLNPVRNLDGQYGTVLLCAVGTLTHFPAKPADMAQAFFDRGYGCTSSSNLGWGYANVSQFEQGCLQDEDAGNIDRVGHRRWLLNPAMGETGIGSADAFYSTYAFDQSGPAVDYRAVAWPSAGPFPAEPGFIESRTPWSISLNPLRYDWDPSGHTITLRRVSDGRIWTFDATDTNTSGEYFNFEQSGYGVANCFIFRPDPASITYRAGDSFEVVLSGGIYAKGTRIPETVSYTTRLVAPKPAPVVTMRLASRRLSFNGVADLSGSLTLADGTPVGGEQVVLERSIGGVWVKVKSLTTDSAGRVRASTERLRVAADYRLRFPGSVNYGAATSPVTRVVPEARVTRTVAWPLILRDRAYPLTGFISPMHRASDGRIQVLTYRMGGDGSYRYRMSFPGAYRYLDSSATSYRASVQLSERGRWKLVPFHAADGINAATYGSPMFVEVR